MAIAQIYGSCGIGEEMTVVSGVARAQVVGEEKLISHLTARLAEGGV